jgi:hypothetical protein
MSTRFLWLLPGSMLILAGAACNGGSLSFSYHDQRPARTRHVHRTHVCTEACHHHYYNGTRVVVLDGHRHGPGCGHLWNGTHWIIVRDTPSHARVAHICTQACHHHYHDGTRLVVLKGHRHGPGCGHVWSGRHWVVARKTPRHAPVAHVCTQACHHHYHNGTKLVVLKGHRHGPGCGHRWTGKHWVLAKAPTAPVKGKAKPYTASPQPKRKAKRPKTHP